MAEHHQHLFHHNKDEENPEKPVDYRKDEKHKKHLEETGGLGAVATGTYALHEKREAKKDPEGAHKHKVEEEIAAAAAVGAGGYAFHESHKKKDAKKLDEEAHGKKNHHLF
ncbi:abscisic stress-ripening protein 2-like [Corylus avellana]|uniref:abscisic stress-ripening protein 2-like n=1 Tax=Corylus avellana TaxID=13451 RepID=UPI001E1FB9DE|nr:abscisic stress-ripening protein 2-like [Corylus avellana]